jgi:tetratricopeptide (TPR) repeat protein
MKFTQLIPLSLSLIVSPAYAADVSETRYATLADCSIDGAASADTAAQNAFENRLANTGAVFVDVAQSRASRAGINIPELARGGAATDAVLAIDADVVVALAIRSSPDGAGSVVSASGLSRYQATIDASLIATDSGERLARFSVSKFAIAHDKKDASRLALQRAGEALADEVAQNERKAERVELWVNALPVSDVERMRESLRQIHGVKSTRLLFGSPSLTKIGLVVDASTPRGADLAQAIHGATDTGLVVTQVSDRVLQAEYAARLKILFTHLTGNKPKAGAQLASLIGSGMRDASFLAEATPEAIDLGKSVGDREKKLEALGLLETTALFLTGTYFDRGKEIDIEAEVRSTRSGFDLYVRDRATCELSKLSQCTGQLASRLVDKLPQALIRNRVTRPTEASSLALVQLVFDERLFPARASFYQARGFGRIVVENRGKSTARGGMVRVQLADLDPVIAAAPDAAPGERVALQLPFTAQALPAKISTAKIQVEVSYDVSGRRDQLTQTGSVRVLPSSALAWSEPESVAAFVSDPTDAARLLATSALERIPQERRGEPVARATALFYALRGLRYMNDPIYPGEQREIDEVQFPAVTLARASGDCDDLAVLYAALAETAGGHAILILTPGHIIPAFDSGLPAQSARKLAFDPEKVIVHEGKAFIPIEATSVDESFAQAWSKAAARITAARRAKTELQIIDLEKAWQTYPPVALASSEQSVKPKPSFAGLKEELEILAKEHSRAVDNILGAASEPSSLDPKAITERASLLVLFGRAEEAIALLEAGVAHFPRIAALTNNLANAHLARDQPEEALKLYKAALARTKEPERAVRIRLNAAIAAHLKGGSTLFQEYLLDAIENAKTEKSKTVLREFLESFGGRTRMSDDPKKIAAQIRLGFDAGRLLRADGQNSPNPVSIAEIVFWLEPEELAK